MKKIGNFDTGEFVYYTNDSNVMLLDIKLVELNQNHELFDRYLNFELEQALNDAYATGISDCKSRMIKACGSVEKW